MHKLNQIKVVSYSNSKYSYIKIVEVPADKNLQYLRQWIKMSDIITVSTLLKSLCIPSFKRSVAVFSPTDLFISSN